VGRKKHEEMAGLAELGARLRELRVKSGLSQMKVSERMGFDPTHGYKYVFRLEKGQVPNPTMRTVASFLEACDASWQDVVEVLPSTGSDKPPARPEKTRRGTSKKAEPETTEKPKPRVDKRPYYVRVREERIAARSRRNERFWHAVELAENQAADLLGTLGLVSNQRRAYLEFIRPCCTVVNGFPASRRRTMEMELNRLLDAKAEAGLDRSVLERLRDVCLQHLKTDPESGS